MFPSYHQFVVAENDTYIKINGKRHIPFNKDEEAMIKSYHSIYGKNNDEYEKDISSFFYGGNIYNYNESGLNSIVANWNIVNQIMTDSMIEHRIPIGGDVIGLGKDFLCPIGYQRLFFGNYLLEIGDTKFIIHIFHPINSSPLTNDPRRQLCIYVSSNKRYNPYILSYGNYHGEEYYPVIHKEELTDTMYSMLIKGIENKFRNDTNLKKDIFNPMNSELDVPSYIEIDSAKFDITIPEGLDYSNLLNREVTVLGGQTLDTCSILWFHIHVLLDCNVEKNIWKYNTMPIHLNSYIEGNKFEVVKEDNNWEMYILNGFILLICYYIFMT